MINKFAVFLFPRWLHCSLALNALLVTMTVRSKLERKVDAENRQFNKEWTDTFLYVLPMGR